MKIKKLKSFVFVAVLAAAVLTGCGNAADDTDEEGYAEGRLGDTMHTEFFDFTVNSAYTCDAYEDYLPAEGSQMMIAELTVSNTFSESIPMFDIDFQVQWIDDADDAYEYPITVALESGKTVGRDMFPDQYNLAEKESRTGILAFEVPAGETEFSISYRTFFDDNSSGKMFFVFFTASQK